MALRTDPDQQLVTAWFPAELADALLARAHAQDVSRAELLRRLAADHLTQNSKDGDN